MVLDTSKVQAVNAAIDVFYEAAKQFPLFMDASQREAFWGDFQPLSLAIRSYVDERPSGARQVSQDEWPVHEAIMMMYQSAIRPEVQTDSLAEDIHANLIYDVVRAFAIYTPKLRKACAELGIATSGTTITITVGDAE